MMEERIKISDVKWLQTELEKIESRLSALEASRKVYNVAGTGNPELTFPYGSQSVAATPHPVTSEIRIRPDDMVMVKYKNNPDIVILRLDVIMDMAGALEIEYISPIQPVRREWIDVPRGEEIVWGFFPQQGTDKMIVRKVQFFTLEPGDAFLPILSPDEPAPEAPCEVG